MTKFGRWFRKHESPSGDAAPFRDSSLQRPQLTDGEITGALTTESREQVLGGSIGFGLEPGHHARPGGFEGILTRAPVSRRVWGFSMRGAGLTVSPSGRPTLPQGSK